MKKNYKKFFTTRFYLLILLGWLAMSTTSCTSEAYYSPTSGSWSGTTEYCQGAAATPNTFTYSQCTAGSTGGDTYGVSGGTLQWYYNTTGATTPGTSTPMGGSVGFTSPAGGSGTINFTPSTASPGVLYYFAYITWGSSDYCTTSYTTTARMITVGATPAAITGATSLCPTTTTLLSNTVPGGTWTSGTPAVATIGAGTGTVTAVTGGTTLITYSTAGLSGCSVTQVETVTPTPSVYTVTGGGAYCSSDAGVHVGLSNSQTGVMYQLYLSGTGAIGSPVSGTGSGLDMGLQTAAGTYTISATNPCATGVAMAGSVLITINPAPAAIGGPSTVCVGSTITMTDATFGGTWSSSSANATVGVTTGFVNGVTAGTAIISYKIASGCSSTKVITVNAIPAITGNVPVCVGSSITLAGTGGTGTWNSGTPANATIDAAGGVMTGVAIGSSLITYTAATTCTVTATATVNAAVPAITGPGTVCVGLTATLADATTGGTWSSSDGTIATIDAGGIVTGAAAGTTTIIYVVSPGCNTSRVESVNPLPAAITGTPEVCSGLTTALSDATTPGTWSSSASGTAAVGASSGIVTGGTAGTATITYTLATSCIATKVVTVDPLPSAITGPGEVCIGQTITMSDTDPGGTWGSSTPAVAAIGASTGIVTGNTSGTTVITYTLPTGCIITKTVTADPLPVAITGTPVVCVSYTTTLTDGTPGGTWSSSDGSIAGIGVSNGVVTGMSGGTATVTYTEGTGCIATVTVTVNTLPAAITGVSGICLGTTATMSSTTSSGTWTSSNTTSAPIGASSGVVTGNAVGTSTITYTINTGCFVTKPVTINPLPATIGGPASVCAAGATVTLTDATSGGTWTSSNTSVATVGLTSGVVTGLVTGPVTITYTLSLTGCTATKTLTVNPVPTSVITPLGDTSFCPGGFVALTATTGTGLTYLWYVDGGFISGSVSSSYIATATGSYMVRVTNSLGCPTYSTPVAVLADVPTAAITAAGGTSTTCAGVPLTLNANTGAGLSYQWLQDGMAIPGAVGSSYAASTPADYSVIVSNGTGCSATSNTISVSVLPSPTAGITTVGALTFCQNDSVVMRADAGTGYMYQWYSTSGMISGANNRSYTAMAAGSYWVSVTNTSGCTVTSAVNTVVVNPLPDAGITASGATTFCTGGSVTLTANSIGGYTYQWYSSGGLPISGATNASYVVTASGNYRVKVTNATTGCTAKTATDMSITVIDAPVVVPLTPRFFCWGGSTLLSTSVIGATGPITYEWYLNGVLIPGAVGATYNATVSGDYKCTITIVGACAVSTVETTVTENPLPNPVVTFDGTSFHVATNYVTYQWYKNLAAITGATGSSTPATGDGDYKVAVTDTNGCQSVAAAYILTGWRGPGTTGVTGLNKGEIKIYPNPAQQMVHVESLDEVRVVMTTIDGRTVIDKHAKDIDISGLPNGVYTIMVYNTADQMIKAERIVKDSNY